jgi:predicted aldo/keto reductase-like oxidoreductase
VAGRQKYDTLNTTMKNINRRGFSGAVFSGLGIFGASAKPAAPKAGSIPMRAFGQTGAKITIIGQGGARLALLRTKEAARAHVQHAYSLGLNYFDCAHSYWDGHSEEVYGDVLPQWRKELFMTTKSAKRTRKEAEEELHASLAALKTDYVDLWQMHGIQTQKDIDQIFAAGGAMEAFEAAKKSGKCRFFGFTGHYDPNIHVAMLIAYDKWDSILMPLHAADPAYLSFEKIALPRAVERRIGIQAIKVFGNAFLTRVLNAEECLRYALSLPVTATPAGCSTRGQLEDNVRFVQDFKPYTPEQMDDVRKRAVTAGPGGLQGPALEYWKVGGVWK